MSGDEEPAVTMYVRHGKTMGSRGRTLQTEIPLPPAARILFCEVECWDLGQWEVAVLLSITRTHIVAAEAGWEMDRDAPLVCPQVW